MWINILFSLKAFRQTLKSKCFFLFRNYSISTIGRILVISSLWNLFWFQRYNIHQAQSSISVLQYVTRNTFMKKKMQWKKNYTPSPPPLFHSQLEQKSYKIHKTKRGILSTLKKLNLYFYELTSYRKKTRRTPITNIKIIYITLYLFIKKHNINEFPIRCWAI